MISTQEIKIHAARPNMPLNPLISFKDSPSSVRIIDVPKKIGTWSIDRVDVQVTYPDGQVTSKECVRTGNVWVATVQGTSQAGSVCKGYQIFGSGTDENGNPVDGYVLGVGDVCIMDVDGSITPSTTAYNIRLIEGDIPAQPNIGDAYIDTRFNETVLKVWNGQSWNSVGHTSLEDYLRAGINNLSEPVYLKIPNSSINTQLRHSEIIIENPNVDHTTIDSHIINVGGSESKYSEITIGNGIVMKSSTLSDDSTLSFIWVDGSKIPNEDWVKKYMMPINGKDSGLFRLGTEDKGVEWSSRGGYLGVYGSGSSVWLDNGTMIELEEGWNQIKKVVSTGRDTTYQTLPDYLSSNYATSTDIKNNKITIKQGGIEKGFFTLNQSTDKTIELDAGGGGDSKCLLNVSFIGGSSQYVSWTVGSDTYKVMRSDNGKLKLLKNGVVQTGYYGLETMIAEVDGNVSIYDNGYSHETNVVLDNARQSSYSPLNTTGKKTLNISMDECLEQDTLITMADGTTKAVCDLKIGDQILTLNPDTLQLEEDEVSDCDAGCIKMHNKMDVWHFADGTEIKTIKPHQFFNTRTGQMEYIADFQIGDGVRKQDGITTTLTGHDTRLGMFFHNTLYTRKYNNYFANGILTGNRKSVKWGWLWKQENV